MKMTRGLPLLARKRWYNMTINYYDVVNALKNNSTPNKSLRVLDEHIVQSYDNIEWFGAYFDNDTVDWVLQYFYGKFIADGITSIQEDVLIAELKNRTHVFITTFGDALNRLYREMLVEFDPIENYDRKEDTKHTYTPTGEEYSERNNLGDDTTSHTITAYNNNSIDGNRIDYNSSITEKKGYSEDRKDLNVTISRIHGNIGVTTAPQMLKEYNAYYFNQSFWLKFWKMYLTLFSKGVFE